jgi:hypothetical protein
MHYLKYIKYVYAALILCISPISLKAANTDNNILTLAQGQNSPDAKIEDVSWIAGYWQGEIWGGTFEEIWSEPSASSMMASFKYVEDNHVVFFEIMTIVEADKSLLLRLKHFNADLTGWEEKDETVDFELVDLQDDTAYFDGYTFKRVTPNEMYVYVLIDNDGKAEETHLIFKRKQPND